MPDWSVAYLVPAIVVLVRLWHVIWTYVGNFIAAVKIGIVGLVLVAGCANLQPPPVGQESQAQRAIDLATSVIVVTDRALAVAIETDDDFESYAPAVLRVKHASETLRKAGATAEDACQALTVLIPVASAISCQECVDLGKAAISVVCPIGVAK
jgi:hypothetical protein